jgi:hypothetical protein
MEELAALACAQAQSERAARLVGAAQVQRDAIGAVRPKADQARYEHGVTACRADLKADAFAEAWSEGQAIESERAGAEATGSTTKCTRSHKGLRERRVHTPHQATLYSLGSRLVTALDSVQAFRRRMVR